MAQYSQRQYFEHLDFLSSRTLAVMISTLFLRSVSLSSKSVRYSILREDIERRMFRISNCCFEFQLEISRTFNNHLFLLYSNHREIK